MPETTIRDFPCAKRWAAAMAGARIRAGGRMIIGLAGGILPRGEPWGSGIRVYLTPQRPTLGRERPLRARLGTRFAPSSRFQPFLGEFS